MYRTRLLQLIHQEALKSGYDFQNGFVYRISRADLRFPALWMEPPVLTQMNGRKEGLITYHITLHLLTSGKKSTETEKEQQWEKLEKQVLLWIDNLISQPEIFSIDHLACAPAEFSLTNRSEISLKTEFDICFAFPFENSQNPPDEDLNP